MWAQRAVQVEQVRVVHLEPRRLGVPIQHDLARVLAHERARAQPVERAHAPAAAERLEDLQPRAHAAPDDAVEAVGGAAAAAVALEDIVARKEQAALLARGQRRGAEGERRGASLVRGWAAARGERGEV